MKRLYWILLTLLLATGTAFGEPPGFERLKTLVGSWKGEFYWTGASTGRGNLEVDYRLTGNGSALVENWKGPTGSVMMTVYHFDGDDLRLTHYCAARNQPRMKASPVSPGAEKLRFDMIDITNLASPEAFHTREIELAFRSADHVESTMSVVASGEESVEHLSLRRQRE